MATYFEGEGIQNSGNFYAKGDININASGKKECLRDLFLTDPSEDRAALGRKKGRPVANTCEWILRNETFTTWLSSKFEPSGPSNVLWLHGNPGTGKSTMAIFLTEELPKIFAKTTGKTLIYFFCDSSFDTRKTATAIVRGLLLQLVHQHEQLLEHVLPKYHERGAKLFDSFDAVWSVFENLAAKVPNPIEEAFPGDQVLYQVAAQNEWQPGTKRLWKLRKGMCEVCG